MAGQRQLQPPPSATPLIAATTGFSLASMIWNSSARGGRRSRLAELGDIRASDERLALGGDDDRACWIAPVASTAAASAARTGVASALTGGLAIVSNVNPLA